MTPETNPPIYVIPAHAFERARAEIAQRRHALIVDHEGALDVLDTELAELDAVEARVRLLATKEPPPQTPAPDLPPKRRPSPRWSPADEQQVLAADLKDEAAFTQLGQQLGGRSASAVRNKRDELGRRAAQEHPSGPDPVPPADRHGDDPPFAPRPAEGAEAAAVDETVDKSGSVADESTQPAIDAAAPSIDGAKINLPAEGEAEKATPAPGGATGEVEAATITSQPFAAPEPQRQSLQEERDAINRHIAEKGVTRCPSPGTPEAADLPLTKWDPHKRKYVREATSE